ncbi:MAG: hypothetical protein K9I70_08095 [Chitinophagaceae bacterium]|nr:hypothetical protein [Chitinophagaceae bacterium]
MKTIFSSLLFLLISSAFCLESASILLQALTKEPLVYVDDVDLDSDENETDKTPKKEEKLFLYHESVLQTRSATQLIESVAFGQPMNCKYVTSDYSQVIYSPPEAQYPFRHCAAL